MTKDNDLVEAPPVLAAAVTETFPTIDVTPRKSRLERVLIVAVAS